MKSPAKPFLTPSYIRVFVCSALNHAAVLAISSLTMPICICLYVTWCLYGNEPVNCPLQCMGVNALSCLSYWLCFEENSQECGILSSLYSVPLSNYSVASVNVFVFTLDMP